jgi:hypothetical protein
MDLTNIKLLTPPPNKKYREREGDVCCSNLQVVALYDAVYFPGMEKTTCAILR